MNISKLDLWVQVVIFCTICTAVISQEEIGPKRRNRARHTHGQNATEHLRRHSNYGRSGDVDMGSELDLENGVLSKINEKLTEIALVSNQQLRKFENLEYKVTKMEIQFEEKINALKLDLKEISRETEQLDRNSGKFDQALDALRSDTAFLKQAFEYARTYPHQDRESLSQANSGTAELAGRMQAALRGIQHMQKDVSNIVTDMSHLKFNISKMDLNIGDILTTKHFMRSMAELDRKSYPGYGGVSMVHGTCAANQGTDQYPDLPMDCSEVADSNASGVYRIMPAHSTVPFFVYCDMETNGGGWTVIQNRLDGTQDFYRPWHDYKRGFGNVGKEHWLGLDKIHLLTSTKINELFIELEDFTETKSYALYDAFAVGTEVDGYAITYLGNYHGNAGDSLTYHAGHKFSTMDLDQDSWSEGSCAKSHEGAWWYNKCDESNLNGRYMNAEVPDMFEYKGIYWLEFKGSRYSLKSSKMMIRLRKDK